MLESGERTTLDIIAPVRDRWRDLRRVPSAEMLAATVHVALATYAQPRSDFESGRLVGWVIVVDSVDDIRRVCTGISGADSPTPEILSSLRESLRGTAGSVWISLPKKRSGLARTLENEGYTVTTGLGVGSRGERVLRDRLDEQKQLASRAAVRSGTFVEGMTAKKRRIEERTPQHDAFWRPVEWRVSESPGAEHLRVAVDASLETVDYSRSFAACAVSDEGDCLVNSGYTQGHAGEVELEAITQALELVIARSPARATVLSDSSTAIELAGFFAANGPDGVCTRIRTNCPKALRSRFSRAWQEASRDTTIRIEHVKGHTGHPLNEAADRIASASRRAAMLPRAESERVLTSYIDQQLERVIADGCVDAGE